MRCIVWGDSNKSLELNVSSYFSKIQMLGLTHDEKSKRIPKISPKGWRKECMCVGGGGWEMGVGADNEKSGDSYSVLKVSSYE